MSRPQVDEFSVKVKYDLNGKPESIRYYDSDGCGHESANMGLEHTNHELVSYHLHHLKHSHDMHPVIPCPVFVLTIQLKPVSTETEQVKLYCNNEEGKGHIGEHTFSLQERING